MKKILKSLAKIIGVVLFFGGLLVTGVWLQDLPQKKNVVNPKIVEWVYNHSSKISYQTAKEIVETTFQTSKYPLLMLAIFAKESNFNPTALSGKQAYGLGQVRAIPEQIQLLKQKGLIKHPRDLFDIHVNIVASEIIFEQKLRLAKGNLKRALYLYVGGDQRYVTDVLGSLGELYLISQIKIEENEKNDNS